ncbi:MAG TPA: phosphatase, partial [Acidobacteriota bacterium]|nr:phosphatase [Acidobacteriota bacterium]
MTAQARGGPVLIAMIGDYNPDYASHITDPQDEALNVGLASIRSGRIARAQRMSADLERIGISGCFDGAMRHAENPNLVSRSHFAR